MVHVYLCLSSSEEGNLFFFMHGLTVLPVLSLHERKTLGSMVYIFFSLDWKKEIFVMY